MLLRQLVRHPLQSVTAQWRPVITTIPVPAVHCGSSRAHYSDDASSDGRPQNAAEQQDAPPIEDQTLFEKLFPDEAREARAKLRRASSTQVPKSAWLFENEPSGPPVLEGTQEEESMQDAATRELSEVFNTAFQAKSMLVLSAVSKNLVESDFLRLGVKGKHMDGWIGGILKVIQARDPDTLEPKGHYFILFDTHEAAVLYKERLEYLWQLGKTYVPGAHHARSHMIQSPLPTGLRRTEQGEDIAELIRSFTLVSPSQRHHVVLSRMSPSKIGELYVEGGFVEQLATRAGSKYHVLLRLEGGPLALHAVRRAIEADGIERNLPWRITDMQHGILPFGKSVLKERLKRVQKNSKKGAKEAIPASFKGEDKIRGFLGETTNSAPSSSSGDGKNSVDNKLYEMNNRYEKWYPRFIVPFTDQAEAYRFVRSWHRRELRLQMGGKRKTEVSWEEVRLVNATVLW